MAVNWLWHPGPRAGHDSYQSSCQSWVSPLLDVVRPALTFCCMIRTAFLSRLSTAQQAVLGDKQARFCIAAYIALRRQNNSKAVSRPDRDLLLRRIAVGLASAKAAWMNSLSIQVKGKLAEIVPFNSSISNSSCCVLVMAVSLRGMNLCRPVWKGADGVTVCSIADIWRTVFCPVSSPCLNVVWYMITLLQMTFHSVWHAKDLETEPSKSHASQNAL